MDSWRSILIDKFVPGVNRLTLVQDQDGLLFDEVIIEEINKKGFHIIHYEDPIRFRYEYETRYRNRWDNNEYVEIIVVYNGIEKGEQLPFDIITSSHKITCSIEEIFPNLNVNILAHIDPSYFDDLLEAQKTHDLGVLSGNATKEYILRHVFEIAPELIKRDVDLLRFLIRKHYRNITFPDILEDYLISILEQKENFKEWPLKIVLSDRSSFFNFLQERWPIFVDSIGNGDSFNESRYELKYTGPKLLPFDHDDIKVYIDNLFIEGLIKPIQNEKIQSEEYHWVNIGLEHDDQHYRTRQIASLIDSINELLSSENISYKDWFVIANKWGDLQFQLFKNSDTAEFKLKDLVERLDNTFYEWIVRRYSTIFNQPPVSPVMLHHIPKYLFREMNNKSCKPALIVMDGMSFEQWKVIYQSISEQLFDVKVTETASFAWAPTLTAVSRQSIFAGKPPMFFPDSIHNNQKEQKLWNEFWIEHDLKLEQIQYTNIMGSNKNDLDNIVDQIANKSISVFGIIIRIIDELMHGSIMGTTGFLKNIQLWCEQGIFIKLLNELLKEDHTIFITSDHGNVFSKGIGRITEGKLAETKGERVRVYNQEQLRDRANNERPETIKWSTIGLPPHYFPLFAPNRKAFIREGEETITHGGLSIEELIVPFVRIERG